MTHDGTRATNKPAAISCACRYNMLYIYLILKKSYMVSTKYFNENQRASNQHIRMISEGQCDTEDWSNHAENSALPSQE